MADRERTTPRRGTPPEKGWALGASGLSRAAWGGVALMLVALSILLFALGYYGYGALVGILAAAAAVNLW